MGRGGVGVRQSGRGWGVGAQHARLYAKFPSPLPSFPSLSLFCECAILYPVHRLVVFLEILAVRYLKSLKLRFLFILL